MEQLPIIIDGKTCGQMRLMREGAYVVCRGQAEWHGEGLQRLWLYGEGEPLYIGVLQPDGTVRKRFSLREFGCRRGAYCGNGPRETAQVPKEQDVLWYEQGDGTLLRTGDGVRYIAFPADGVRLPRGCSGVRRMIEGREYVVFPC